MSKQRPTELNKRIKRLETSRDGLKQRNRAKNLLNQKLRDRNVELVESRDNWKTRNQALVKEKKQLQQQIEEERKRADKESQRAAHLLEEIETIRKKK